VADGSGAGIGTLNGTHQISKWSNLQMPLRILAFVMLIASSLPACSHGATGGVLRPAPSEDRAAAEIYAAVVRQLVTEQGTVPLDHVYVLDGPVVGAADPIRPVSRPKRPFDRALSDALAVALKMPSARTCELPGNHRASFKGAC
jgi:hypothetical protein